MPRYTPTGWWECDLFHITERSYSMEFEVKLTVADFRRDAEKSKRVLWTNAQWEEQYKARGDAIRNKLPPPPEPPNERKHDLLAAGDPRGPSSFYYVTPEGLLDKEPLPPWAGWIEIYERTDQYRTILYERPRVKAPKIHTVKVTAASECAMNTAYYRMHRFGRGLEAPVDEYLVTI